MLPFRVSLTGLLSSIDIEDCTCFSFPYLFQRFFSGFRVQSDYMAYSVCDLPKLISNAEHILDIDCTTKKLCMYLIYIYINVQINNLQLCNDTGG
jgi:hypothetical protein